VTFAYGWNGETRGIDPLRRQWLEKLVACCERVFAADRPDPGDPYLDTLMADVEALRGRLAAELFEDDSSGAPNAPTA